MDKQDWYNTGARIGDIVNDAIRNNDYQSLNETITNALNDGIDVVQENLFHGGRRREGEASAEQSSWQGAGASSSGQSSWQSATGASSSDATWRQDGAARSAQNGSTTWRYEGNAYQESWERAHVKQETPGTARRVAGKVLSVILAADAILLALAAAFLGDLFTLGIPAVIFALLSVRASKWSKSSPGTSALARRAQQYLDAMGGRDVISVEELAAATGKSQRQVKRDLRKIIQGGKIAGEVYLDEDATTLMTSREAYQKYQDALKSYRLRSQEARQAARTSAQTGESPNAREMAGSQEDKSGKNSESAALSKETQQILEEGNAFIRHIHEANDRIPDETMSAKLSRLEMVVTRIFEQVAAAPDSAPDLHKMMNYYLPTTIKLVDAYAEMDRQQVQGSNITKTKQEIEKSLDTINNAFEVFLDSFFQDKAWDIETDIQTLQTMMARDGLTGSDFPKPGDRIKSTAKDVTSASTGSVASSGSAVAKASSSASSGGAAAAYGKVEKT